MPAPAAQVIVDGPSYEGAQPNVVKGTGFVIGDGYILTAGHVAYDYDHMSDSNPSAITIANIRTSSPGASVSIVDDYRQYRDQYAIEVSQTYLSSSTNLANDDIEAHAALRAKDSVLIAGAGSVTSSDAGLVVFLDDADIPNLAAILGSGAVVTRYGNTTGAVTGTILAASNGALRFNQYSVGGDSGGAYVLDFDSKAYVVGTQSASSATQAYGTYLFKAEWDRLNTTMSAGQTLNVTSTEPTNLIVGRATADGIVEGSYRADIILGRDGDDTLKDGDVGGDPAWADDQLFGGDDNDTLIAGAGHDLLHGGDYHAYSGASRTILDSDGVDTVDYSGLTAVDPTKGIEIALVAALTPPATDPLVSSVYQTALSTAGDFDNATFVKDQGRDAATDTLVSIEKIVGTSASDTLKIKSLAAGLLAGSDGQGGLNEVDLAGGPEDVIDASALNEAVTIDLSAANSFVRASADATRQVIVRGVETVKATAHDDIINGGSTAETLIGNGGADTFRPGGGNDIVWGDAQGVENWQGTDTDVVDYSAATRPITIAYLGEGVADPFGGVSLTASGADVGRDILVSVEKVVAGSAFDRFEIAGTIGAGTNLTIDAGAAGGEFVNLDGAQSAITFTNSGGVGTVSSAGGGTIALLNFKTQIRGSSHDDVISDASDEAKSIDGGDGDDWIGVQGPSATLIGGAGDDTLIGGDGNDVIIGGSATVSGSFAVGNRMYGGGGNDYIVSTSEYDYIEGGDGSDYISLESYWGLNLTDQSPDNVVDGGAGDDVIDLRKAAGNGSGALVVLGLNSGHDTILGDFPRLTTLIISTSA